jgi:hypothetical protein
MTQHARLWYISRISRCLLFGVLLMTGYPPAHAASLADVPRPVSDAAVLLIQYGSDSKAVLDEQAIAPLVDYLLTSKSGREYSLPESNQCPGAYYEFDTKITLPRFLEYCYSALVPSNITRPSSLRYSTWSNPGSDMQKMPSTWGAIPLGGPPLVIRGLQHDSDTPHLATGVYHEYDLKRTLILFNHKGRQVLISVSKQINQSSVGKKAIILGNDIDWTYFYSNEPGTMKTGLGWAKSYIYDYFSVVVYAESNNPPAVVRTGVLQWLRAGWLGINFVKQGDILDGMKRSAHGTRTVLESPHLPAPRQLTAAYQTLSRMAMPDLAEKYAALHQALRSSAIQAGKVGTSASDESQSFTGTSKEQMIEELMLEYLKMALGKPSVLGKQPSLFSLVTSP